MVRRVSWADSSFKVGGTHFPSPQIAARLQSKIEAEHVQLGVMLGIAADAPFFRSPKSSLVTSRVVHTRVHISICLQTGSPQ